MSQPTPATYKTTNWPSYNEALEHRGSLTIWFAPEMRWDAAPTGKRGRRPIYSDAAVQTCLTMKVLFGMALRQTTGFVESLLKLVGLDWTVPDFSTLSGRQKTLVVNIPSRDSRGPSHLLVDSTGIKGECHARKHGGIKRRVRRKVHLGIDEQTLEVRAVEVTGNHIDDRPVLPDLLGQIPPKQEIGSVTADGAYDTRKCHDAIADRGAHAVIPPRKNANPRKPTTAGTAAPDEALRASKSLGRAIWRNWSGYHRRSRAETKMNCMKLLGQRLMARDFDRQVAEVQIPIGIMNGYTALGTSDTKAVEQVCRGKGEVRSTTALHNKAYPGVALPLNLRQDAFSDNFCA